MHVLQLGKLQEDLRQLLAKVGLRELDLAHVEGANTGDFVMSVNDCWGFSLRLGQDNVREVLGRGDHSYFFEVVVRHDSEIANRFRF